MLDRAVWLHALRGKRWHAAYADQLGRTFCGRSLGSAIQQETNPPERERCPRCDDQLGLLREQGVVA
jgi:hypothetical protein